MKDFNLFDGKRRREDDGRAPLGRKARLWFEHALRERLSTTDEQHPKPVAQGEELEALVARYAEAFERYVVWLPAEAYHGKRFSTGAWELDTEALNSDLRQYLREIRRARAKTIDDAKNLTLDEWLRADIAGTLADRGAVGGSSELAFSRRVELEGDAIKRRRRWPRACTSCGESFRPSRNDARRCPECLATARASSRHPKAR